MSEFVYRPTDPTVLARKATQSSGDFQGFIHDEIPVYAIREAQNAIRILPATWDNPTAYSIEVYAHYRIGPGDGASVLCLARCREFVPHELGRRCPICEVVNELQREGHDDAAKELGARKRSLVFVLDRRDPDSVPAAWAMPITLDRDIASISRDRQTGEYYHIDNPYEGFDVYFDKSGKGIATKYTGVTLARQPTGITQDALDFVCGFPLPNVLRWRTYEEIAELYYGEPAPAQGMTNGQGAPVGRRPLAGPGRRPLAAAPVAAPAAAPIRRPALAAAPAPAAAAPRRILRPSPAAVQPAYDDGVQADMTAYQQQIDQPPAAVQPRLVRRVIAPQPAPQPPQEMYEEVYEEAPPPVAHTAAPSSASARAAELSQRYARR